MGAEDSAYRGDVVFGDEVFHVLVFEDQGAVFVRGEEFNGAVGAFVLSGAIVLGDASHGVLTANGEDELEVGMVERVGGGDECEAAGEAEAHDADGAAGLRGEPVGGFADGAHGGGVDVVVLDVGELRGEDAHAAGGHGGGKGHEAGLVDAEVMDAVEDDEGGCVGEVVGEVEAGADVAGLNVEGEVVGRDGVRDGVGDEGGDGFAGDLLEDGDGFEMVLDEGPGEEREEDEAGEQERVEDGAGVDALSRAQGERAGVAEVLGKSGESLFASGLLKGFEGSRHRVEEILHGKRMGEDAGLYRPTDGRLHGHSPAQQGTVLPIKRCLVRRTEDARVLHGNGVSEARGC